MKKRQRKVRLIRAVIQLIFFIVAPALFSTAFAGVKSIFQAIAAGQPVTWNSFLDVTGALLLLTVLFGTVSLEQCRRQDRHHRKDCSHRTQKLTEKALLCTHANQDQHKQNDSYPVGSIRKFLCCQHGKHIPWTHSLKVRIPASQNRK